MNNQYLIPANSKKSQLIFSVFRGIDLIILLVSGFVTLILLFIIPGDTILTTIIKLLPISIGLLLIMPIPYYHNVLVFLQEFWLYLSSERQYLWRGWCATYGFGDSEESKDK